MRTSEEISETAECLCRDDVARETGITLKELDGVWHMAGNPLANQPFRFGACALRCFVQWAQQLREPIQDAGPRKPCHTLDEACDALANAPDGMADAPDKAITFLHDPPDDRDTLIDGNTFAGAAPDGIEVPDKRTFGARTALLVDAVEDCLRAQDAVEAAEKRADTANQRLAKCKRELGRAMSTAK